MIHRYGRRLIFCVVFAFVAMAVTHAYCGSPVELKKGNIIRIVKVNVDPQKENDFIRWYCAEHENLLLKVPGVIWTYKAKNHGDKSQKYFFLYVHENMAVQKSEQYKAASRTDWAKEIRPYLKDFKAANYEVIISGLLLTKIDDDDIVRTVEVDVASEKDENFNQWYNTEHLPLLGKVPGVSSIWRAVNLGDKGQHYLTVYFQDDIKVQKREDYKAASKTEWLKSLMPHLKNYSGNNYVLMY